MLIDTSHVDWTRPVIWVNANVPENDTGLNIFNTKLASDSICDQGADKTHLVVLDCIAEDKLGKQMYRMVDEFGWFIQSNGSKVRVIFNFVELEIDNEAAGTM